MVTPDFANVIAAFFSIPTRIELNQALHSITAEPYASMQSVALEAMEQFGKNSLDLTDRSVPLTHTQTFCKTDNSSIVPADSPERPTTCDEREKTVGSRWSLLLYGTSELASLNYNVFSTIYGLHTPSPPSGVLVLPLAMAKPISTTTSTQMPTSIPTPTMEKETLSLIRETRPLVEQTIKDTDELTRSSKQVIDLLHNVLGPWLEPADGRQPEPR